MAWQSQQALSLSESPEALYLVDKGVESSMAKCASGQSCACVPGKKLSALPGEKKKLSKEKMIGSVVIRDALTSSVAYSALLRRAICECGRVSVLKIDQQNVRIKPKARHLVGWHEAY